MLRLKNIRHQSDCVTADIYPDDSSVAGFVAVNPKGLVDFLPPVGYEYMKYSIEKRKILF